MEKQMDSLFTMDVVAVIVLFAFIAIYASVKVVGYIAYLRRNGREAEGTFEKEDE